MQTKIAQFSKRLTASIICLIMLLSMFTQVAFADWTPPVANGSEGVGTGGGVTTGTFTDSLSGYRVSIISRTGEMIKAPQDFLFSTPPVIHHGFLKNKFGHSTDGSSKNAPEGMPKPILFDGTTFQPNGLALKSWLMGDGGKVLGKFVIDNFGYTDESLAAVQKDIKIVFEPIFFYKIQSLEYVMEAGKDPKLFVTTWTPEQRIYGTITEIAKFTEENKTRLGYNWTIVNGQQVKGGPVYGGNASVVTVNAGPNALITSKEDKELGINEAKAAAKMLPEYVTKRPNGIGLHIYSSEGGLDIPETHTWDFPIQTPAPAPDPKDIPKIPDEIVDKTRIYNIVKTYRDRDKENTVTHVATYSRTKNPAIITIQDEPEYKVKEWYTSTLYNSPSLSTTWEDNCNTAPVTGPKGTKPNTTTVIPSNTTLYVLLEKTEKLEEDLGAGELIIRESQVTKAAETMTTSADNWGPKTMTFSANDISGSCPKTFYHSCRDCSYSWSCGNPYRLNDTSWDYNHINSAAIDAKIHANGGAFDPINAKGSDATGNRNTVGTYTNFVSTFNYKLVIWRGLDVPTIANYKEPSSNTLNTLVKRYGKEPAGQRYSPYSGASTKYNAPLKINLTQDMALGDYITTSVTDHGYSKSANHTAANTLNYDTTAQVEVYYGKAHEKGNVTASGTQPLQTTIVGRNPPKYSGGQMQQSGEVTWYPYIRMTYQTTGKADTDRTNVNILSQWLSELTPNDYVEAAWVSDKEYNMNLRSAQWSLHNRATSGDKGWNQANRVLPGGALYSLDTKNNKTWASVVTWQPYIEEEVRNKVVIDGTEYTYDATKAPHDAFVAEATKALEGWRVVQHVKDYKQENGSTPDIKTNTNTTLVKDGVEILGGGQSLSGLNGLTGKTSTEDKYYMKPASTKESANEGDIDILKTTTIEIKYKVTADVEGKIHVYRDRDNSGWVEILTLKKNQGVDELSGEALALDQRTKVITNLCKVLTRNTGNDKTAAWAKADGKWYNEAFDGICYTRRETQFELGYKAPNQRTAALDPALCPPSSGQSDLFSKAFLSQFYMNDKSDAYPSKGEGFIGAFKGMDVVLAGYKEMFKSMPFAIPNVNVQDLN